MYSLYPKNIAYLNKGQDRDHNIYTEEFLGGADTYIYINNELFKDISAIQYSIMEQQKPIYGYASRLYDDVATGVRIVQGLIKVPVRNTENNEVLTFVPDFEKDSRSLKSNIPDWVYRYNPNNNSSEDLATINNINNDIYSIQEKLKSEGYNVKPTGILDNQTKIAILKYRKNNGEIISLKNINNILQNGESL